MFSEELFHFFVAVGGGVLDGCGELREDGCKFGHGVFQAVAGDEDFFVELNRDRAPISSGEIGALSLFNSPGRRPVN